MRCMLSKIGIPYLSLFISIKESENPENIKAGYRSWVAETKKRFSNVVIDLVKFNSNHTNPKSRDAEQIISSISSFLQSDLSWLLIISDTTYIHYPRLGSLFSCFTPSDPIIKPYFFGHINWVNPRMFLIFENCGWLLSRKAALDIYVNLKNALNEYLDGPYNEIDYFAWYLINYLVINIHKIDSPYFCGFPIHRKDVPSNFKKYPICQQGYFDRKKISELVFFNSWYGDPLIYHDPNRFLDQIPDNAYINDGNVCLLRSDHDDDYDQDDFD